MEKTEKVAATWKVVFTIWREKTKLPGMKECNLIAPNLRIIIKPAGRSVYIIYDN